LEKNIILGTAGHIDHGKTSLVKALTGIETDRLKEEKERGITIELGFASLVLPNQQHIGIVDMPGHEKTILFNWSGHGLVDLAAYESYFRGKLSDHDLPQEQIDTALKDLEALPKPKQAT